MITTPIYATPTITSSSSFSITENTIIVATLTADTTVSWSLTGGEDQAKFNINSSSGSLSFKNAPDYEAPQDTDNNNDYIVDVTATDSSNSSLSSTQTITVTITDTNVPTVSNVNTSSDENNALAITLNGSDADGNSLTYSVVTPPSNGTVSISGEVATYTPNSNYVGSDSFTYKANNGIADSATNATVNITIIEADFDNDGITDNTDTDDDGDGVSDLYDLEPFNASVNRPATHSVFSWSDGSYSISTDTQLDWSSRVDTSKSKGDLINLFIGSGVTSLSTNAFSTGFNNTQLRKLIITNGISSIPSFGFYYWEQLDTIIIPPTVTTIASEAFSQTRRLKYIIMPDGISFENWAFAYSQANHTGEEMMYVFKKNEGKFYEADIDQLIHKESINSYSYTTTEVSLTDIVTRTGVTMEELARAGYGDNDNDGIFDSIDTDDDNDGVSDNVDAFPYDANETLDTDGDGIGNNADTDDDGDKYSDAIETFAGTSPIDASNFPKLDLSDRIDVQISEASGLDSIESNLTLWLDAKNIDLSNNSSLSNGDALNQWVDLSGNGNNATQTVSGNQPTYQSTENEVYFNDDFMNIANAPIPVGATENYTIIAVSRLTEDNNSRDHDGVISSGKNTLFSREITYAKNY
ncbi:MAG: Ig-like domain-containing protein, partial [Candidatus Margulisiibacteriota bacterium]